MYGQRSIIFVWDLNIKKDSDIISLFALFGRTDCGTFSLFLLGELGGLMKEWKVRDWKLLLGTVFLLGGLFVWSVIRFFEEISVSTFFTALFLLYSIKRGLTVSFSQEEYEKGMEKAARNKSIQLEMFGKMGQYMLWVYLLMLVGGSAMSFYFPLWEDMGIGVMWCGCILCALYIVVILFFRYRE